MAEGSMNAWKDAAGKNEGVRALLGTLRHKSVVQFRIVDGDPKDGLLGLFGDRLSSFGGGLTDVSLYGGSITISDDAMKKTQLLGNNGSEINMNLNASIFHEFGHAFYRLRTGPGLGQLGETWH